MTINGEYAPSPAKWVRDQVEEIESSGGADGNTMRGMPVVVLTMRGAKTGKIRKVPLMRVEHEGVYGAVASVGGAHKHPVWYYNLVAEPRIELQDGTEHSARTAREVHGDEKVVWWARAVEAYPDYAEYQKKTQRQIPLFVLEPAEPTE